MRCLNSASPNGEKVPAKKPAKKKTTKKTEK